MLDRIKRVEGENQRLRERDTAARAAELAADSREIAGTLLTTSVIVGNGSAARELAQSVRDKLPHDRPGVAAVAARDGDKGLMAIALTPAARTAGLSAGALIKEALEGHGGGTDEVAQGGGLPASRLDEALHKLTNSLATAGRGDA